MAVTLHRVRQHLVPQHPTLVLASPLFIGALILHLTSGVTPTLATDFLAFAFAAISDRRPIIGAAGVGLLLLVTALIRMSAPWPTLAEYSSILPVAVAFYHRRLRVAGLLVLSYVGILSAPAGGLHIVLTASLWVVVYAGTWAIAELLRERRRAQERAAAAQLAAQRQMIARELHDTVAHELSLMSMHVQQLGIEGSARLRDLDFIIDTCDTAIVQLRAMLAVLRSTDTAGLSRFRQPQRRLAEAYRDAVDRLTAHGFDVERHEHGALDSTPASTQWALAGVCHEVVNNVITHGAKGPVTLQFEMNDDEGETRLAVFNRVSTGGRRVDHVPLGLVGLKERVEAVGGRLYTSASGEHWMTMACIPHPSRIRTPRLEDRI